MKKIICNSFIILLSLLFILTINIFFKINSNLIHIIGINIVIFLNLIISLACIIISKIIFKKNNQNSIKKFNEFIKTSVADSFFITSIISIISSILIYCLLKKFLYILNIDNGIINYTVFAAKIWFISSPFIGLEIVIFKYFKEINYSKKIIFILIIKFILYLFISLIAHIKYPNSCLIYAKPICDFLFLFYYSKICFQLTLNKN